MKIDIKRLSLAIVICSLLTNSESIFSLNNILHLMPENVFYTWFTPNYLVSNELMNLVEGSIEVAVHYEHCSESTLEETSSELTARPVVVCANENVTMLKRTVEQIAAMMAAEQAQQPKWSPYYLLIWPDKLEDADAAGESLKTISVEYDQSFHLNTDVYVLFVISRPGSVALRLWEFYEIGNKHIYREIQLTPNLLSYLDGKIHRRSNFQNLTIRAIAEYDEDFELDVKFKNGIDPLEFESGMNVDTLRFLADSLNFSIKAFVGTVVQITENNTKTKQIPDQIVDGDVDICISEFYVSLGRSAYFKFLHSTFAESLKAYFTKPAASDFRDIFLVEFQWDVWLAGALVFLVLVIMLKLFLWITMCFLPGGTAGNGFLNSALYSECYIFVVGVATQQGWHIQPESKSIRVIFLVGYLTGLVCFVAYSAATVSALSVKRDYVSSVGDLIDKNYQIFADYDFNPIQFIRDKLEFKNHLPENMPAFLALNKMVTSKSAFVSHADEVYPVLRERKMDDSVVYSDHVICDRIRYVDVGRSLTKSAMVLKKGSYLADFFNSRLLRQRERGVHHGLLVRQIKNGRVTCNPEDVNVLHALGFQDALTAFLLLFLGYLFSFLALSIEMLWNSSRAYYGSVSGLDSGHRV